MIFFFDQEVKSAKFGTACLSVSSIQFGRGPFYWSFKRKRERQQKNYAGAVCMRGNCAIEEMLVLEYYLQKQKGLKYIMFGQQNNEGNAHYKSRKSNHCYRIITMIQLYDSDCFVGELGNCAIFMVHLVGQQVKALPFALQRL